MISIDKLQHVVVESAIHQPAAALAAVNKSLKLALRQKDEEEGMRDGMDIALISINKTTLQMEYAGANRPVWIIRNGEVIELAPSKASIGGFTSGDYEFGMQALQLQTGDCVYLFSDGFADQVGGPRGKKMMTKQFREILLSCAHLAMREQEEIISRRFDEWKGELEQVDDVCVVGLRV
jgi:serine phosphatase RsbU (regulator of sigma subunit)